MPSMKPTFMPSSMPTDIPSKSPSRSPTGLPSVRPSYTPTAIPSIVPSIVPSIQPSMPPGNNQGVTIAAVAGSVSAGALLFFLGLCFKRKRDRDRQDPTDPPEDDENEVPTAVLPRGRLRSPRFLNRNRNRNPNGADMSTEGNATSTIHNSVVDQSDNHSMGIDSLISSGSSGENDDSDSDIEYDDTINLADEFDRYKDENLEKMRSEMEKMDSNFDSMMSSAMTKALMDDMDDDDSASNDEGPVVSSAQLEATVLCNVTDLMKQRSIYDTTYENPVILQGVLDQMVLTVRRGHMSPEDASRAIHGCALLLGLELAENYPKVTLIVTGMRKQVTNKHLIDTFEKFGEIESAGVSTNNRGFGMVRYKSPKSVEEAMRVSNFSEIVVQDVDVNIKLLGADKDSKV